MLHAFFAFVAGAATVFGFAPFRLAAVPVLTVAILFHLWSTAVTPRLAARLGFAFGLGLFGAGVSWVSIALHTFGAMPLPLAAVATFGFCAYLALFPALAGWLARAIADRTGVRVEWLAAPVWTLTEWARGWVASGFPWLSLGYSQVPQSPLAGLGPVGGTYAITLAVTLIGASAAWLVGRWASPASGSDPARRVRVAFFRAARIRELGVMMLLAVLVGGAASLRGIAWTRAIGEPLSVSLLQGNVRQELKFQPGFRDRTLALYRELVERARGRLVVLPESALPMFAHEVPADYAEFLKRSAEARGGALLFGVFILSPGNGGAYHNSVIAIAASHTGVYQKRHLVPFGETIPLAPLTGWFINRVLKIPLADQTPGPADQPPLDVAGQRLAIGICYEDAFGAETIAQFPAATLLVNVSNDAWYGRSIAAEQHHQIAQARALETGRWMLRATQTGITALVDPTGAEVSRLPWFTTGVLEGRVQGRSGATPYVRVGDRGAVVVATLLLLALIGVRRYRAGAGSRSATATRVPAAGAPPA